MDRKGREREEEEREREREREREEERVRGEEGEWGEDTCNKTAKILLLL